MEYQNMQEAFIWGLPVAELHLHLEGTIGESKEFKDLQDFLTLYYDNLKPIRTEEDFYNMTRVYFEKARSQGVVHAEVFFDPQTHMDRGVSFDIVFNGIYGGLVDAEKELGVSNRLIMCFLRDLPADYAMWTLERSLPYKARCEDRFVAVGLDSAEVGNPPSKFKEVFDRARAEGFLTVAHAGEEGPPEYVQQALDLLKVSRIDHGNRALDDPELVGRLVRERVPLTVCPLSNVKLQVVKGGIENHPLKRMLESGLFVTVNSDDPAYFGGYVKENYLAVQKALGLSREEIYRLARNSFEASFLPEQEKQRKIAQLNDYAHSFGLEIR